MNEAPERELGLHDDRPTAVQTADADAVEAAQLQDAGRIALLIDAVTGRPVPVAPGVNLLRRHALHSLLVVHVDTKRPSTRQVVVDQLTRDTQLAHVNSAFHPSGVGESIEHRPVWLGLRRGAFTCVRWQVV